MNTDQQVIKEGFLSKTRNKIILILIVILSIFGLIYYTTSTNNQDTMNPSIQTLDNGLIIEDILVGSGDEIKSGDNIEMHYTGTFENGEVFDSSVERNQPFPVTIGVGQVIPGWDQGVPGMKVGGKRKLTIPPALAYGEQGIPGAIPGNSTLIFEVEALEKK